MMSKKKNRSRTAPPHRPDETRPHFRVGQRVVCVDAAPNPLTGTGKLLVAGRIYVIRAIDARPGRWGHPGWGVHLVGIRHFYFDGLEWAFHPRRFRPVEERDTDITVFREIAAGSRTNAGNRFQRHEPTRREATAHDVLFLGYLVVGHTNLDLQRVCDLVGDHDAPMGVPRTPRQEIDSICLSHEESDSEDD